MNAWSGLFSTGRILSQRRCGWSKIRELEKYELYLRPGDTDSHYPLKLFFGDGGRDRSDFSQAFRDMNSRKRQRQRPLSDEVTQRRESDDHDSDQGDVNDASFSQ